MSDKICPYCHKSIKNNFYEGNAELICPHGGCGKRIPGEYLNNPVKHVASISQEEIKSFRPYVSELQKFVGTSGRSFDVSRAEHVDSDDAAVQMVLFEYSNVDYTESSITEVIAFHHSNWKKDREKCKQNIEISSSIILNVNITEFNALYFNVGLTRSKDEYKKWEPYSIGKFIRDVKDYLSLKHISKKVAILLGNMQALHMYPNFREDKQYQKLVEVTDTWSGRVNDRMRIADNNDIIKRLLIELGEDSLVNDMVTNIQFFLYPNSESLMVSSTFWMMAVLLWVCVRIG